MNVNMQSLNIFTTKQKKREQDEIPFTRGLAQVRHHSLEVWVFYLFTFEFVEQ